MKTIARNRTKLINEIFAAAVTCTAHETTSSSDADPDADPVEAQRVREFFDDCPLAKLVDDEDGTFRVFVTHNPRSWFRLDTNAQPAPVAKPVEEQPAAQEPLALLTREQLAEALLALVEHGDFRQLISVGNQVGEEEWKITMFGIGRCLETYEGATVEEVLAKWGQRKNE